MYRLLVSICFLALLSGCDTFVKRHPQQKQSFNNERSPSQNSIAALQAENSQKTGIIVPDPSEFMSPMDKMPKDEVPLLAPITVTKYQDEVESKYQLNDTEQVATFIQVSKKQVKLKNPPKLNHRRKEIAQELLKYETNYIEHPSEDFFSMGKEIPVIPASRHVGYGYRPIDLETGREYGADVGGTDVQHWRHHAPYYYDSQNIDTTRPHYLQDLEYVQQPEKIKGNAYKHYPRMLRYEDEEWVQLRAYNDNFEDYYGLKDHTKSRNILEYERFFSLDN